MRTTLHLAAAAALAGLVALACSEGVAPSSDQTQALAAEQEQLGAMVDSDFGATGATPTASLDAASSSAASFSVNGTHADTAPGFSSRLRVVPAPEARGGVGVRAVHAERSRRAASGVEGRGRGGAGGAEVAVDHGAQLLLLGGERLRLVRRGRNALATRERHQPRQGGGSGEMKCRTHRRRLLCEGVKGRRRISCVG